MSIPGKIRTDYHSKQLKCHNSFNVPAINTEWWYVIKTPLFTEVDDHFFSFVGSVYFRDQPGIAKLKACSPNEVQCAASWP